MRMVGRVDVPEALATFVAVARERSFTRGAARLGQPQPVASRRVAALERRWGVALLQRSSRSVSLTPEGERLLPLAEEVLAGLDRVEALFTAAPERLVLAVPAAVDARTRATVRRGLPRRRVEFVVVDADQRERHLAHGGAHLALTPVAGDAGDLVVPLGLVGHPGGRLRWSSLRRPLRPRGERPRRIHLRAEDDVPAVREPVRAAAAEAGLRADQVVVGTGEAEAWTSVHEWDDVVVATRAEAEREALEFFEPDRVGLRRGYRLLGDGGLGRDDRTALVRRLARGLGGEPLGGGR